MRLSLRLRVALSFAAFGAAVSVLLAAVLFFAAHDVSQRLIDETLRAELDDYVARRSRNPYSLPPSSVTLRGYVLSGDEAGPAIPPPVRALAAGRHEISLDGVPYRVAVTQRDGARFFLLFNETRQRAREQRYLAYLGGGALLMTLLSAAGGFWLAGRVIAPVTELARRVGAADPDERPRLAPADFRRDDVGELARAFEHYLARLHSFVDRERAFTADVSHELRTPVAVILGAVELLQEDPRLTESQRERLARIERAAHDMAELIRALLLMAREEGTETQSEAECDAAQVLRECVERHRHLVGSRPTEVELAVAAEPRIAAEPTLFAVVAGNLIRNALAHTEAGTVSIRLDAGRLTISDTGTGIKAGELGRVFQRYYRGAASSGAGIGLSLTKRICDRYGWTISIESREGEGTLAQLVFSAAS
ncbi:MAG: HAMP domain-containing histidine kinase [Betaproteobacteria bacterium]|nr:HAMP domain-containing histidine kinase [Betaproteobacteria bacterium]